MMRAMLPLACGTTSIRVPISSLNSATWEMMPIELGPSCCSACFFVHHQSATGTLGGAKSDCFQRSDESEKDCYRSGVFSSQ